MIKQSLKITGLDPMIFESLEENIKELQILLTEKIPLSEMAEYVKEFKGMTESQVRIKLQEEIDWIMNPKKVIDKYFTKEEVA